MSLMSWFRNLFSSASPAARPRNAGLGRNDLCWCGSGKKYKRCHLDKDEAEQREANYAAMAARARQGKGRGDGITRAAAKMAQGPQQEERKTGGRR